MSRETAYKVLYNIETQGTFSSDALSSALRQKQFDDKRSRAFVTRLVEGVTERRLTLDFVISKHSRTRLSDVKPEILTMLRMGIYQIVYMDTVPDHAAISETVKLAREHHFEGLTGYVNAVLRAVLKSKDSGKLRGMLLSTDEIRYSTPQWLCDSLKQWYGKEQAHAILASQFEERDTTIRLVMRNLMEYIGGYLADPISGGNPTDGDVRDTKACGKERHDMSRDSAKTQETDNCDTSYEMHIRAYTKILEEHGIKVSHGKYSNRSLHISGYDFVRRVPGYREGVFFVQDESSSCAVESLKPEGLVVDMCAAPGGKTMCAAALMTSEAEESVSSYMAEKQSKESRSNSKDILASDGIYSNHIISRDISDDKTGVISENIDRLKLTDIVEVQCRDALEPDDSLIGMADTVIADVPCSGLGVIGRKNDIKYHVTPESMEALAAQASEMLRVAASYVKPGGRLMYSTCTINPGENEDVTAAFLAEYSTGKPLTEEGNMTGTHMTGKDMDCNTDNELRKHERRSVFEKLDERTFLPGDTDGFYYCIMRRVR